MWSHRFTQCFYLAFGAFHDSEAFAHSYEVLKLGLGEQQHLLSCVHTAYPRAVQGTYQ